MEIPIFVRRNNNGKTDEKRVESYVGFVGGVYGRFLQRQDKIIYRYVESREKGDGAFDG